MVRRAVDGSSPSEGFTREEIPGNRVFFVARENTAEHLRIELAALSST